MEKLNVKVGLVFTQVMFCDGQGRTHCHQVMTDLANPWKSIKEVLGRVKKTLYYSQSIAEDSPIDLINIELKYKNVNFMSILQSLREELRFYLSEGCLVSIQTMEENEEAAEMEELQMVQGRQLAYLRAADELEQDLISVFYMEGVLFPLYRKEKGTIFIEQAVEHGMEERERIPFGGKRIQLGWNMGRKQCSTWKGSKHRRGSPNVNYMPSGEVGQNTVRLLDG
ncbi:hypothetical protein [Ammoniphilus sp. 3BR4]|uniref:hypothetical protein n=1 Tax=Ammoniphilus sp. 3BR4 TaxID=3158265 RepID=UPI0034665239